MNGWLDRLLDLDTLSAGAENVRFAFERDAPLYLWVGVAGAAVLAGFLAYRKLAGPRALRWSLVIARAALLMLIVTLLAGPSLERRTETVEQDWILALVDRSQSLAVPDAAAGATRDEQLRESLVAAQEQIAALGEDRVVRWFGFGDGAYELDTDKDGLPVLGPSAARRTDLEGAVRTALRRATARPLAGMLVLSDGRATRAPGREELRELTSAGAPVHVVPLGASGAAADVAVRRVVAPPAAYKDDPTPVRVELATLAGEGETVSGEVRLIDATTDGVLETQRVELGPGPAEVQLTHRASDPGAAEWRVEFVPDAGDLIETNNRQVVSLEIVDRPLRVLYLDGAPRWEQRYLRNLFIREASIESSNLMLAPTRRYLQEGDVEIATLPSSPGEWADYDLVVLGDLDPGVLTPAQLDQLRLFVAEEGGGLIWIGGESHTPADWWSTPLAALLPFQRPRAALAPIGEPVQVHATNEAERLGVLRLLGGDRAGWPEEFTDPRVGWSALHWAQLIDRQALKPSTAVLASAAPIGSDPLWPLVMTMRYGAGRVVYVATDEIWRWRYGRGEVLYERFWIQLARLLARERLVRSTAGYALKTGSDVADVGEPITLSLELQDQSLVDQAPELLRVRAALDAREIGVQSESIIELTRSGPAGRRYSGVWTPPAAGRWTLEPLDPLLRAAGAGAAEIEARLAGDELADPRPDHELLASLASITGGRSFDPADLASIADPGVFPSRSVRRVAIERETLWDTPLALALLIGLAGFEWIGRRIMRLM